MSSPASTPHQTDSRSSSSSLHRRKSVTTAKERSSVKADTSNFAEFELASQITSEKSITHVANYLLTYSKKITQENIKTLSTFILHNKLQHACVVSGWLLAFKMCTAAQQIALFYAVNEVLQTCRRKGAEVYRKTFPPALYHALCIIRDYGCFTNLSRLFNIWSERGTLSSDIIAGMRLTLQNAVERAKRHFNDRGASYQFAALQTHVEEHRKIIAMCKVAENEIICDLYCRPDCDAEQLTEVIKDRAVGERDVLPHCAAAVEKCQNAVDAYEKQLQKGMQCLDDFDDAVVHEVMRTYECKIVTNAFAEYYERLKDVQEVVEKHLEVLKPNSALLANFKRRSNGDSTNGAVNTEQTAEQRKQESLLARFRNATGSEPNDLLSNSISNAAVNDIETIEMDIAEDSTTAVPLSRSSITSVQAALGSVSSLLTPVNGAKPTVDGNFHFSEQQQIFRPAVNFQQQPVFAAGVSQMFDPRTAVSPLALPTTPIMNVHQQRAMMPLPQFVGLHGMSAAAGVNVRRPLLFTPPTTMPVFQQSLFSHESLPVESLPPGGQSAPSIPGPLVMNNSSIGNKQAQQFLQNFNIAAMPFLQTQPFHHSTPAAPPHADRIERLEKPMRSENGVTKLAVSNTPVTESNVDAVEADAFISDNLLPRDPRAQRPSQSTKTSAASAERPYASRSSTSDSQQRHSPPFDDRRKSKRVDDDEEIERFLHGGDRRKKHFSSSDRNTGRDDVDDARSSSKRQRTTLLSPPRSTHVDRNRNQLSPHVFDDSKTSKSDQTIHDDTSSRSHKAEIPAGKKRDSSSSTYRARDSSTMYAGSEEKPRAVERQNSHNAERSRRHNEGNKSSWSTTTNENGTKQSKTAAVFEGALSPPSSSSRINRKDDAKHDNSSSRSSGQRSPVTTQVVKVYDVAASDDSSSKADHHIDAVSKRRRSSNASHEPRDDVKSKTRSRHRRSPPPDTLQRSNNSKMQFPSPPSALSSYHVQGGDVGADKISTTNNGKTRYHQHQRSHRDSDSSNSSTRRQNRRDRLADTDWPRETKPSTLMSTVVVCSGETEKSTRRP